MKLLMVALLLSFTCGCVVKKPIRAMYCNVRNPDGTCHTWATGVPMNHECVPSPAGVTGVCQ